MAHREDYYQILGVDPEAAAQEIRAAYRRKALDLHLDRLSHLAEAARRAAEEELKKVKQLAGTWCERAIALGGTMSGEHGIGAGKTPWMRAEHGAAVDLMAEIKRLIDPKGIFNPGKMLDLN